MVRLSGKPSDSTAATDISYLHQSSQRARGRKKVALSVRVDLCGMTHFLNSPGPELVHPPRWTARHRGQQANHLIDAQTGLPDWPDETTTVGPTRSFQSYRPRRAREHAQTELGQSAVSYTHLTPPTKRDVYPQSGHRLLTKKKSIMCDVCRSK